MKQCPSERQLERLLDETLVAAERAAVERHLERCEGCQEWLDQHVRSRDPELTCRVDRVLSPELDRAGRAWASNLASASSDPALLDGIGSSRQVPVLSAAVETNQVGPPGYVLVDELGRGAAGIVYRARHEALNRTVALKVLGAAARLDSEAVRRFRIEAEAAARLQHPNIVQVYEIGEHDGVPYLALEFIEGGCLARSLHGEPWLPQEAAILVEAIARAIQHAHDRGVVHRDLKPSNVMLCTDGVPKLTDFGLAKLQDRDGCGTHSGALIGTPSYMAPEQASSRGGEVGPVADVYAVGAVLYELLTGRPPFRGESAFETLIQVIHTEPVSPSRLRPSVPRDLETICLKCLEKHSSRRYTSAAALADDLRRYLAGEPVRARPAGLVRRWCKWGRRHPARAALAAVILFAVVAVVWQWRAEAKAREGAVRILYLHQVALAHREWDANNVVRAEELLDECPPDLRDWEWYYLKRLCHSERLVLTGHNDSVRCLAVDKGGRRLVAADYLQNRVVVWDLPAGQQVFAHELRSGVLAASFTADGSRLTAIDRDGIEWVWDAATGQELSVRMRKDRVTSAAVSPCGRRLALGIDDRTVRVTDPSTGRTTATIPSHRFPVKSLTFSLDGLLLAACGGDPRGSELRIWDVDAGRGTELDLPIGKAAACLAFSPDARTLVSGYRVIDGRLGERVEIQAWDVAGGQPILTLPGHWQGVSCLAFSPDGRRLVSCGGDRIVRLWEATTGSELMAVKEPVEAYTVVFGPDGTWVATGGADGVTRVWDVATHPQEPRAMRGEPAWVMAALAFFPDGRLVSAGLDGSVRVWDPATGRQTHSYRAHTAESEAVAVSPDGHTVASAGRDRLVCLQDVDSAPKPRELRGHTDFVFGVAFAPDGRTLASAGRDGTIRIWDVPSGSEVRTIRGHTDRVLGVTFSKDGRYLASAGYDGTARVWDVSSWELLTTVTPGDDVTAVAFSPDGRRLATAGGTSKPAVRMWDARTGRELPSCRGHLSKVTGVAFSRDGRRLVSCSDDQTVRLWDTETGREALRLECPAGVTAVAFSPDSRQLVAADWQKCLRVWNAAPRPAE